MIFEKVLHRIYGSIVENGEYWTKTNEEVYLYSYFKNTTKSILPVTKSRKGNPFILL
jgi:hypothetical protein